LEPAREEKESAKRMVEAGVKQTPIGEGISAQCCRKEPVRMRKPIVEEPAVFNRRERGARQSKKIQTMRVEAYSTVRILGDVWAMKLLAT